MQKFIRRGNEECAMWCAEELADAGEIHTVLCRLEVMAQEDVGIGDPSAVLFAQNSIERTRDWLRKKNDAWHLGLANAVLSLARAKKCRLADNFQCFVRGRIKRGHPYAVPDYALDKHTYRGKRMGRGLKHFLDEGAVLENRAPLEDSYQAEAERFWLDDEQAPKSQNQCLFNAEEL